MTLEELITWGSEIDDRYAEMGKAKGYKERTPSVYCGFLLTDLGELTEQVMIKEQYRGSKEEGSVDEKIAHELSDCLWVVLMLAKHLNVDLEEAYNHMIENVKERQRANTAG